VDDFETVSSGENYCDADPYKRMGLRPPFIVSWIPALGGYLLLDPAQLQIAP
jgi:hypothetical protein